MTLNQSGSFVVATATLIATDLASKVWAVRTLDSGPIELAGPLDLKLSYNEGIAFGLFGRLPRSRAHRREHLRAAYLD